MHRQNAVPTRSMAWACVATIGLVLLAGCAESSSAAPVAIVARPTSTSVPPPGSTSANPPPPPPAVATAPFVSPITAGNKPNPVAGDTNGEMPAEHLVNVAPGCVADRASAPSLGLLFATARARGTLLGASECYRPVAGQVAVGQAWTGAGNSTCAAPVVTSPTGAPKGTSMHGWGRAADFSEPGRSFGFDTLGYRFLEAEAARFGWNHPGWAQPGGSACPEPWHWEWVGDGGALHASAVVADVVALVASPDGRGYSVVTGLGSVSTFGASVTPAQSPVEPLAWLVVGAARTSDGRGLWLASAEGGVLTVGDAHFLGSAPSPSPSQPVVGIAATPRGDGYWLVASDGRVTAFGVARTYGTPPVSLARSIVGVAATPSGLGYWLAAADGTVFPAGDAGTFQASGTPVSADPVVAIAATPSGRGYWLAHADGVVAAFGDAVSLSPVAATLNQPVVGISSSPTGRGYWLVAADGGVFTFGDAAFFGRR